MLICLRKRTVNTEKWFSIKSFVLIFDQAHNLAPFGNVVPIYIYFVPFNFSLKLAVLNEAFES